MDFTVIFCGYKLYFVLLNSNKMLKNKCPFSRQSELRIDRVTVMRCRVLQQRMYF